MTEQTAPVAKTSAETLVDLGNIFLANANRGLNGDPVSVQTLSTTLKAFRKALATATPADQATLVNVAAQVKKSEDDLRALFAPQ